MKRPKFESKRFLENLSYIFKNILLETSEIVQYFPQDQQRCWSTPASASSLILVHKNEIITVLAPSLVSTKSNQDIKKFDFEKFTGLIEGIFDRIYKFKDYHLVLQLGFWEKECKVVFIIYLQWFL